MSDATRDSESVQLEVRIDASPEAVFPYFTDPAKMLLWKGVSVTLDPRPGGVYRVEMNGRDVVRGEYLEVTPNSRVVFTWGWEGSSLPPGSSTVEVTLIPDGDGTIVRLRHLGLTDEQRVEHAKGWEHYMARLTIAAAGGTPGPDPLASEGC